MVIHIYTKLKLDAMHYSTLNCLHLSLTLECPPDFNFVQGYAKSLEIMIMMLRNADSDKECATICRLVSPHCHSILWNEGQKSCIIDQASEEDISPSISWNGWITCVKGKHGVC